MLQPCIAVLLCFCLRMIFAEEFIISVVVTLHRGRVRSVGTFDDGVDQKPRNDSAIRIAGNKLWLDNFFGHDDHPLGSAYTLNHDTEISPAVCVAFTIGALNMNDSHIGVQSANCPQRFLGRKWRKYLIEKMISLCSIRSQGCLSR